MELARTYKIQLDNKTTNADKNIVVNLGDAFNFYEQKDLIDLRSEIIMDKIFAEQNPTIDFEKYKFDPESGLLGMDFYFYRRVITTKLPDSYNDTVPPVWYYYSPVYDLSSEYTIGEVPDTSSFLNSYFKFDFYLDPITQKALFSVVLPLDGTMLIPGQTPRPEVDFRQTIKTEIENIYWLRNPEQLPETIFNGTTLDLYCTVSFFNYKNSKTTRFKINNHLPNSSTTLTSFTSRDYYIKYILNYNTLKYNITDIDGGTLLNNNRIKLYAV